MICKEVLYYINCIHIIIGPSHISCQAALLLTEFHLNEIAVYFSPLVACREPSNTMKARQYVKLSGQYHDQGSL